MAPQRTRPGLTRREIERYRAAKRLAMEWMSAMRANFRGLAARIEEHPCYISRFFHPDEQHAPCAQRPAMLRVLEKVERQCSALNDVVEVPLDDYRVDVDDGVLLARNQLFRLRALRNEFDPAQALVYIAEPCQVALYAEASQRAAMCTDVLLTMVCLVMDERARQASRELLERSVDRIARLETAALESVAEAAPDYRPQKAIGYAGAARAHAGWLLNDAVLVQLGMQGMLRAAAMPHPPKDQLWHNVLGFTEKLLASNHRDATRYAQQVVSRASADHSDSLRRAVQTRELPRLRRTWQATSPAQAMELFEECRR